MSTSILDRAVAEVGAWDESRAADRERCAASLETMADRLGAAAEVWREAKSQASGEADRFRLVIWFGPERARRLHALHLEQLDTATELAELTGIAFADTLGIDESVDVVTAYSQLAPDASGSEMIDDALATLESRQGAIAAARESLAASAADAA